MNFQVSARRLLVVLLFIGSLFLLSGIDIGLVAAGNALSDETIWYLIRSSGIVAFLLLTASTAWGILLSSKIVKEWVPAAVALELHNYVSWTALGLSIYHAYLLLFSSYYDYRWIDLLIPFTGPFEPLWVGLGIISVYLMLLTSVTFYVSKLIGFANFRRLHYLTYAVFAAGLIHSWMAGTDSAAMQSVYVGSSVLVLFLTFYRILSARGAHTPAQTEATPYTLVES